MNQDFSKTEARIAAADLFGPAPESLRSDIAEIVSSSMKRQTRRDDFRLVSISLGFLFVTVVAMLILFSMKTKQVRETLQISSRQVQPSIEFPVSSNTGD